MSNDIFDFGFTLVDENELEAVQQAQSQVNSVSSSVVDVQDKLDKLYNAVQPLLNNLKQNPEKEYILWPKRLEKIEQFEDHIQTIYKG
jgi:peptidoglycan hydrolase CwlO-like protein